MEEEQIAIRSCIQCNNPIGEHARFCNHCGALQEHDIEAHSHRQGYWLTSMIIFFTLDLIICLIWAFNEDLHSVKALLVADSLFAIIAIIWFVMMRKELWPVLRWNNFSFGRLALYILIAIASAYVVNKIVSWLNRSMFDSDVSYYETFAHLEYGKLITILFVAVQPALIEELSYRGIMQEGLSKVIDRKQALIVTAFLFAIIHMSFISLFWLLPFAFYVGYMREKENTIWYGVMFHFFFNATGCVLEFF